MKSVKQHAIAISWNKAMVGLIVMGVVVVAGFISAAVIAATAPPVPQEMWDTIRLAVIALGGAAAAQTFNGKVHNTP